MFELQLSKRNDSSYTGPISPNMIYEIAIRGLLILLMVVLTTYTNSNIELYCNILREIISVIRFDDRPDNKLFKFLYSIWYVRIHSIAKRIKFTAYEGPHALSVDKLTP